MSIKEAFSAKRKATDGASLPPEWLEEQFGDSDVDYSRQQAEVLECEPSHSISEHDERSDEPKEMHVELLQAPHQPRSGVFPKEAIWPEKARVSQF